MQPPKIGFSKKEKHRTSYEVQCFFGGEYRAVSNHGELLQSMHGALPAELMPHSFGTNKSSGQTKKHHTLLCSAFLSGGEYRDRTGDLLHAMQALSRTTHSRTPTQRCEDGRYLALERFISRKTHSHPKATLLLKRVSLTMYSLHPVSRCCQDVLSPFRHQTG